VFSCAKPAGEEPTRRNAERVSPSRWPLRKKKRAEDGGLKGVIASKISALDRAGPKEKPPKRGL
jgi:hypothetical protein